MQSGVNAPCTAQCQFSSFTVREKIRGWILFQIDSNKYKIIYLFIYHVIYLVFYFAFFLSFHERNQDFLNESGRRTFTDLGGANRRSSPQPGLILTFILSKRALVGDRHPTSSQREILDPTL